MNEEIIKDYERDFRLFCSLAADSQIEADSWNGGDEAAICWASRHAFELSANQMAYRLELLEPGFTWPLSVDSRQAYVKATIDQIIKEKIDYDQKT